MPPENCRPVAENQAAWAGDLRAGYDYATVWMRIGATHRDAGNTTCAHGLINAYNFLGSTEMSLGNSAAAMAWYRKSLHPCGKLLPEDPRDVAAPAACAMTCETLKDYSRAADACTRAADTRNGGER